MSALLLHFSVNARPSSSLLLSSRALCYLFIHVGRGWHLVRASESSACVAHVWQIERLGMHFLSQSAAKTICIWVTQRLAGTRLAGFLPEYLDQILCVLDCPQKSSHLQQSWISRRRFYHGTFYIEQICSQGLASLACRRKARLSALLRLRRAIAAEYG